MGQKNGTAVANFEVITQIMFATLVILSIALLASTANARTLLQEEAAAAVPATWYPGQFAGQYFNPSYWTNFYSQAVPYDLYANWVNTNTGFNLPVISGLPGLPPTGST